MNSILLGKTQEELTAIAAELKLSSYRGNQIANWIYKKHAVELDEMTNLPAQLRSGMSEHYRIGRETFLEVAESKDGTKKYLFPCGGGRRIETALIPDGRRNTLCVSTQAGCERGCRFCFTARSGFNGNINASEILNQYASVPERDTITNIVFMGMGEPFDNTNAVLRSVEVLTADYGYAMSPTRLTVSTVGVMPGMKRYLNETRAHLAISLNSPFADERARLMPIEKQFAIKDVVKLVREYDWSGQRRLTFEYIMFAGVNDSRGHAEAVARLLRGLECRVNLIPFNSAPGLDFASSSRDVIERFQGQLKRARIMTIIRKSKGGDIAAACGQLSGERESVRR